MRLLEPLLTVDTKHSVCTPPLDVVPFRSALCSERLASTCWQTVYVMPLIRNERLGGVRMRRNYFID